MSDSQEQPWSDNPNAPKIPYNMYFAEKAYFAGIPISLISYGFILVLFFKCMIALFNPYHHRGEGIKWGLVTYTTVMFSFVTVCCGMKFEILLISFVDNREFPGVAGVFPPGPIGYQWLIYSKPLTIVPNLMFFLNNWLADGLLLYRCYVIYAMNFWVIAFPCLMYLGSLSMGIILLYQASQPDKDLWNTVAVNFGLPYFSISIAFNILLTLMIIIRLVLHSRKVNMAMGLTGMGGLCRAVVTMLIESSALYAVNSLLFVVPWGTGSHVADIFLGPLSQTQVIAALLIIQRVANKSALTRKTLVSGRLASFKTRNRRELMSGSSSPPDGDSMSSVDGHRVSPDGLEI